MIRVDMLQFNSPDVLADSEGGIYTLEGKQLTVYASGQVHIPRGTNVARKAYSAAKIVAMAYHPNVEGKRYVNFRDGNKLNLHPDNIFWSNSQAGTRAWTEADFDRVMVMLYNKVGVTEMARNTGLSIHQINSIIKRYEDMKAKKEEADREFTNQKASDQ